MDTEVQVERDRSGVSIPTGASPVLDLGYVLLTRMTHDIEYDLEDASDGISMTMTPSDEVGIVADARVSTGKTAKTYGRSEQRTLEFLLREDHTSPFRGQVIQFEIKAPLFVARQWWKYIIGSDHNESISRDPFLSWNEMSRRYVETAPEFYIPYSWRSAPERRAQGSGGDTPTTTQDWANYNMESSIGEGMERYHNALAYGICAEQARLYLPAYAMYTTWRWTVSLQGLCHFLKQRLDSTAQSEIQEYARAIKSLSLPIWPITIGRF